jgi:hypothetical protein
MPINTYILRKYHSKMSDLPASQLVVTGNLTVDLTRPNVCSTYILTKGGAAAITLGAPIAGSPKAGGQDGFQIKFVAGSAQAHVVSVAAGINGAGAGTVTATFGGALGDCISLEAYNGNWYTIGRINITLGTV